MQSEQKKAASAASAPRPGRHPHGTLTSLLKFAGSSLTGFAIDYSLYSLLVMTLSRLMDTAVSVPLSNITARVVSASANFSINKHLVFRSDASTLKTGAQYFVLAACILTGNTVLLSFMVNGLGVNKYAAKLVTELTFFGLSWLAQKFWIFRKKEKPASGAAAPSESSQKESSV